MYPNTLSSFPSTNLARRVRVVHILPQLEMGGLEMLLVEFAKHHDRKNFDLHFISLGHRGKPGQLIEDLGFKVISYSEPLGLSYRLLRRLAEDLKAMRPDIVHAHNNRPMVYASFAAKMAGVPITVCSRHGRAAAKGLPQKILYSVSARLIDRLICVSEDVRQEAIREKITRSKNVISIRNGMDVSRFSFRGPNPSGPILMVGRLNPIKDIPTLLRAFSIAQKERDSLRLEIVGDGPSRSELERLSKDLGMQPFVTFRGELSNVASILGKASLFVLSSLSEGISVALLEAMATGLPVVATDVGGNPEVVRAGETGILVPASRPEVMAQALLELHRSPERAREMGRAGRQRVEESFGVERMMREYESLYLDLLKKK